MKNTVTPILLFVMILSMLAGCGGKKAPAETTASTPTATSSATTAADTTAATTPIPPRDPAYNVGEIRIGDVSITEYKIVLPEDPAEAEQYAAEELIKYIELATGKTLEKAESADKAIYVGGYPDEALVNDGFDIKVVGDDLIISGSSDTGTLYGVYTFLEEYVGWRWLDGDYEIVKVNDFIQIPLDTNDRQVPPFWCRQANWYSLTKSSEHMTKRKMMAMQTDELYCGGFVHTLSGLISIDKYYDEHPEYFSGRKDWQPCLTNPEVFQIVLASVRERLEQYPNAKLISISQNDYPTQCTCENCLKVDAEEGSRAGAMLRFVNAIAEAIAEDYPDVVIDTLAYQNTRALPLITRPRENVQIRLCAIECCYMHSIDDPNCKRNRSFMEDLKAWSEVSEHLAIWEYTTNFDSYCSLHPNLEVLNDNMETYAQYGVDSIFCEANAKGVSGEFGVLKAYLLSKLQWDPYMTEEEYQYHINDFLECYYGPGWQVMRDLLDDLTSNALEQGGHVVAVGDRQFYPYYGFEPEDLEKIKADWAEARELALDDAQRLHLDRSYVSVLMAEASYYFYHMFDDPSNKQKFYDMIEYVKGIAIPLGIPHSYDSEMTAW